MTKSSPRGMGNWEKQTKSIVFIQKRYFYMEFHCVIVISSLRRAIVSNCDILTLEYGIKTCCYGKYATFG